MTEEELAARATASKRLVRGPIGAEPAAVAANAAPRPIDEDAAARPGVASAETGPPTARDLVEEGARREGVGELPDR